MRFSLVGRTLLPNLHKNIFNFSGALAFQSFFFQGIACGRGYGSNLTLNSIGRLDSENTFGVWCPNQNLSGLDLIGIGMDRIASADSWSKSSRTILDLQACWAWSMSWEAIRWEEADASFLGLGLNVGSHGVPTSGCPAWRWPSRLILKVEHYCYTWPF